MDDTGYECILYYLEKLNKYKTEKKKKNVCDLPINLFIYKTCKKFKINNEMIYLTYINIRKAIKKNRLEYNNNTIFYVWYVYLMIIHKYLVDIPYTNKLWAKIIDEKLEYINTLERRFLDCIDYTIERGNLIKIDFEILFK